MTTVGVRMIDAARATPGQAAPPSRNQSMNIAKSFMRTIFRRSTRVGGVAGWVDAVDAGVSLLTSISLGVGRPLRYRPAHYRRTQGRKKLIAEHIGLLLTASAADHFYPCDTAIPPTWIDDLPGGGPRPDLLFRLQTGSDIAGEGRGRSAVAPDHVRATQTTKLAGLQAWSRGRHGTQWFMAWAWITDAGTTLDVFDPGDPTSVADVATALARQRDVYDNLHDSSPSTDLVLQNQSLRGGWRTVDPEDDEERSHLLILTSQQPIDLSGLVTYSEAAIDIELAMDSRCIVGIARGVAPPDVQSTNATISDALSQADKRRS